MKSGVIMQIKTHSRRAAARDLAWRLREKKTFGLVAFATAILCGAAGSAQPPSVPDLNGAYVLEDVEGSGSWTGMQTRYPKADLLNPQAGGPGGGGRGGGRGMATDGKPHGPGETYVVGNGGCGTSGVPGMYSRSAAISIVQGKDAVIMAAEVPGARHIYMSAKHPDFSALPRSAMGYSTGHYEGDSLVIDTVKLAGGMVAGGGRIGPDTHLTEKYRLLPGGKRLELTFTWSDPSIYRKPHTYQMFYAKQPADSVALEEWCDSSDPRQKESITPPPQQ